MSLEGSLITRTQRIKSTTKPSPFISKNTKVLNKVVAHPQSTRNVSKVSFDFLKPKLHSPKKSILSSALNDSKLSPRASFRVPALPLKSLKMNNSSYNSPANSQILIDGVVSNRLKGLNITNNSSNSSQLLNSSIQTPRKSAFYSMSREFLRESSSQDISFPLTPANALKKFMPVLTDFEQAEILEYQQIYFLGLGAQKIKGTVLDNNYGFDDDRGDYRVVMGDHIAFRFEVISSLGRGSFGQVLRCKDHKHNEIVALKIIRNKKRFHKQGAVEVKVLKHLRDNDPEDTQNVIKMRNYFVFRKHLCLTFELLSVNLYEFLKANKFEGLSLGLVRRFAIQILIALKYSKLHNIIHCDLKPENILLKHPNRSSIKVIDWGSSCFHNERIYTYIQSRFYRAPEIILGIPYTTSIDMWSFGCILVELYTGYPLFPGESEHEQILRIMELLNIPDDYILDQSTRKKLFFDTEGRVRVIANSRGKKHYPGTKTLASILKTNDALFLDLIERILVWDPETRLSPEEALRHPWVSEGLQKTPSVNSSLEKSNSIHKSGSRAVVGTHHSFNKHILE